MSKYFDKKYNGLMPYTPGEQPRGEENVLKLNTNENPFIPGANVLKAVREKELMDLRLYSDPDCRALNAAIAKSYGVKENCVFTGNGSDEVLAFCFMAFGEKGIAFADMTYGFYPVFANLFNVKAQIIPLRADFSLAPEDYADFNGTVLIANPNAPTGICLDLTQIESLLEQNKDRLVIIDEAYVDFGGESAVSLTKKYENLLIVQTLSKSRALAGVRLGFAIANEALINDLNTVKFCFNPYNINALTQYVGIAAFKEDDYYAYTKNEIIKARTYTAEAMKALGFTVFDSKANFIFAGNHSKISGEEYFRKLRAENIIVRHFDTPRESTYIRISIGTMKQMKRFIEATKTILEEKANA